MTVEELLRQFEGVNLSAEVFAAVEGDYIPITGAVHDPFETGDNVLVIFIEGGGEDVHGT